MGYPSMQVSANMKVMSDPQNPSPGPGWWLASDGRWYPPESAPQSQAAPVPQQQPAPAAQPQGAPAWQPPPQPAPRKSGKGCLIALAIVGAIGLVVVVLIAFAIYKFADTVEDVADGITVGDIECPTEDEVSDIIGYDVELVASGSIIVASGCSYTSSGASAGVAIISGSGLIAEDVFAELATEAQSNGAEVSDIDAGDDGKAFGSETRSEAVTKDDGNVVQVEIFSEGAEPIGDKKDEAEEILE